MTTRPALADSLADIEAFLASAPRWVIEGCYADLIAPLLADALERAASELAMQQYFEYALLTLCGIPEITLTGTVEDWRSVRQRTQMLAEFELAWWTSTLLPVLDEFVAAASGRPDLAFWRHIFKHSSEDGSGGGTFVHGWILLIFPYLTDEPARPLRINPILASARGRSPVQSVAADTVSAGRRHLLVPRRGIAAHPRPHRRQLPEDRGVTGGFCRRGGPGAGHLCVDRPGTTHASSSGAHDVPPDHDYASANQNQCRVHLLAARMREPRRLRRHR